VDIARNPEPQFAAFDGARAWLWNLGTARLAATTMLQFQQLTQPDW
jgi:hypothetical protein